MVRPVLAGALALVILLGSITLLAASLPSARVGASSPSGGGGSPLGSAGGLADPNVTLSDYQGLVSSSLNASGSGFGSGSPLALAFGPVAVTVCLSGGLTANATGNFSCVFQVPAVPASEIYVVNATNGTLEGTAVANFTVDPPTLGAVPIGGPVGSSVTVSGTGYAPSTVLALTFGPTGISTCSAGSLASNASGDLVGCSFPVPLVPAGLQEVSASDGVNTGETAYTVSNSTLSLSPESGNVSESVTATGTGFGGDAPLSLTIGGTAVTSCTAGSLVASGSGSLDCTFTVPALPAGAQPVVASDGTNPAFANFTVYPQLTLAPASGAVGTAVTAAGTGFDANLPYSVTWNSTVSLCSGTTDGSGSFSCALAPIPPTYEGPHALTASEGLNTATAGFEVSPALSLSPSAGIPGVSVELVGTGLGATTSYAYCFLASVAACSSGAPTFLTASDGSIPSGTTLTVPSDGPGAYYVDVSFGSTLIVDASFTVTTASVVLEPAEGPVGTSVAFSGSGYQADTTYAYCFQPETAACEGTPPTLVTNGTGALPAGPSVTVPEDPAGTYYVDLSIGGLFVSAGEFTLESNLTLAPVGGMVGTTVTAGGTGFDASAAFSVEWNSTSIVCSGTTDSSGNLACHFEVPYSPGGNYPVVAEQGILEVAGSFEVLPGAVVTPSSGPVGGEATVAGTGFIASAAAATVTWGSTTAVCATSTNATGSFSCGFAVPAAPAGAHSVTASQRTVSASTSYTVVPSFYLSPNSGPVGTSVSVVGAGFDPTAPFSVVWGGSVTLCAATTSSTGGASCSFVVPPTAFGSVTVAVVEGTYSPAESFTVGAGITVAPGSGVIGSMATVTGVGFDPDSAYTVSWDTGMVLCADLTNSTGGFTCTFAIPTGPGGAHMITALQGSHIASVTLVANPYLELVVPSGTVGSTVSATGVGFGAAALYSLAWNATTPLCSGTTTSEGGFACAFSIPIAPGGISSVTAQGSGLSASAALTVGASLGLSPSSGMVGTAVTATGYGFGAETAYAVTWNSSTTLCSGTTNSNGVFVCAFAVPPSTPGAYTISASSAAAAPTGSFTVNASAVVPPPVTPASSAPFPWWEVGAIAAAFIVCFLAALAVLRRRARSAPDAVRPWDGGGSMQGGPAGPGAPSPAGSVAAGAASSASTVPAPIAAGGAVAAQDAPPNPEEDIDVLMARLEQMSLELYKNKPDRLAEGTEGDADSDEAAATNTDAGEKTK